MSGDLSCGKGMTNDTLCSSTMQFRFPVKSDVKESVYAALPFEMAIPSVVV